MATVNLKYSWFLNQKGVKRAKRMRIRYSKKVSRLITIRNNARDYHIKLGEETHKEIESKIWNYERKN